jgi:transcription-repair coupling factor (superfamily II helicase)
MNIYKELDSITNSGDLEIFKHNIIDRFGEMPQQGLDLLLVLPLRWFAVRLGIERIVLKNNKMVLFLVSNPQSNYYSSPEFRALLAYIGSRPKHCLLSERDNKCYITVSSVPNIQCALNFLSEAAKTISQSLTTHKFTHI